MSGFNGRVIADISCGMPQCKSAWNFMYPVKYYGWNVHCMPFEIGARGFIPHSFNIFFSKLGAGCRVRRRVAADTATTASHSSARIWSKFQIPHPAC